MYLFLGVTTKECKVGVRPVVFLCFLHDEPCLKRSNGEVLLEGQGCE